MSGFFEKNYNLRYFETHNQGKASPTAIFTLLEETAAEHCHSIGHCLHSLEQKNIGWVLVSGVTDMIRYPGYKENITIRTWVSKYSLVRGYRENIIFDEQKNVIGKAKGLWVFYDIEKRKPAPIFDEIKARWGRNHETVIDAVPDKMDETGDGFFSAEYNIYRTDVDSNQHVNNIRYFRFLLESLPEEFADKHSLKLMNVQFFAEARYGDKVQVYVNDTFGSGNFLHTMKSSADEKILVKAHTQWEALS